MTDTFSEFHFYIILPLFLWLLRKSKLLPLTIILAAILFRSVLYHTRGEVQFLSYWTIVGRIDQFAFGMLLYQFRGLVSRRHWLVLGILTGFALFYWYFDRQGGFYGYPANRPLWIFLPTIEGIAYAVGIAWYESSFTHSTGPCSTFIGRLGEYSYSIYLLHFFVAFRAAKFVHEHVMSLSSSYLACLWSVVFFISMMPLGYICFRFIESPFLKLRKRYVAATAQPAGRQRGRFLVL